MYTIMHPHYDGRLLIKYSKTELVDEPAEVQHPIVRAALEFYDIRGLDINFTADVPAGTGLGSSCSFTVSLLHALRVYTGQAISAEVLAREAAALGMDVLKDPIGKQDSYAAAYGGMNFFRFNRDESVDVTPIKIPKGLNAKLLMFKLGGAHNSHEILRAQTARMDHCAYARMAELATHLANSLEAGEADALGPLMHENWMLKRELSPLISNVRVDHYYEKALAAGATGGKLLGAGGGGYLLIYCEFEHQDKLREALADLPEMLYSFDELGSRAVHWL